MYAESIRIGRNPPYKPSVTTDNDSHDPDQQASAENDQEAFQSAKEFSWALVASDPRTEKFILSASDPALHVFFDLIKEQKELEHHISNLIDSFSLEDKTTIWKAGDQVINHLDQRFFFPFLGSHISPPRGTHGVNVDSAAMYVKTLKDALAQIQLTSKSRQ
jgi:hypothetical protein